jgi:acyl-coenzyme A thioesterase PaaI-like protein
MRRSRKDLATTASSSEADHPDPLLSEITLDFVDVSVGQSTIFLYDTKVVPREKGINGGFALGVADDAAGARCKDCVSGMGLAADYSPEPL